MSKYWEIKLAAARVGDLLLYGEISNEQFWGDELTPKQIDAELKALGDLDTLNVRINSPGGNVFAAQAIYSIVKRHPAPVKMAYIDGLAASAATLVPCACHQVRAFANAMMMIHKPWGAVVGNADLLRQRAEVLDKTEAAIVNVYAEKTHLTPEELQRMMERETWMTAAEAMEHGFIDGIDAGMQVAALLDGEALVLGGVRIDLARFEDSAKLKEVYREAVKPPEPVAPGEPDPEPAAVLAAQAEAHRLLRRKLYHAYEEES